VVFNRTVLGGFLVTVVAAAALGALVFWLLDRDPDPGDTSNEAGFARDMAFHHSQAVEMAMIITYRTDDERLRTITKDMALTQQGQIGMMNGWLQSWDLPFASTEPRMAWMGHEVEGLMPGMATREEVDSLETLPVDEAEREFLRLMIIHHEAAIPMAEAVLDTDVDYVRQLAESIITMQTGEIALLEGLLEERGGEVPETTDVHRDHGDAATPVVAAPGATPVATPHEH
jgi:uncharacterized protein (DUF305 family)